MGYKTKIDWCDSSWNPVTGCLHGCEYCYARKIANRFGGGYEFVADFQMDESGNGMVDAEGMPIFERLGAYPYEASGECHVLENPADENDAHVVPNWCEENYGEKPKNYPYPWYFDPTFHKYRLNEPKGWKKPRNIFVCSMADLFGEWVPMEWIREVFNACREAEQHRYIFLTKNPSRLRGLEADGELPDLPNFWYGSTVETYPDGPAENCWNALFIPSDDYGLVRAHTFVSIEPILGDFSSQGITNNVDWVIVGAETGLRAGKVTPERRWIENLVTLCEIAETPLFMKDSLRELMGDGFKQEFPWEKPE